MVYRPSVLEGTAAAQACVEPESTHLTVYCKQDSMLPKELSESMYTVGTTEVQTEDCWYRRDWPASGRDRQGCLPRFTTVLGVTGVCFSILQRARVHVLCVEACGERMAQLFSTFPCFCSASSNWVSPLRGQAFRVSNVIGYAGP